mmetsp:Transcript_17786/g.57550  ORF Transcript_17786/g.57550 Transcript_17786/m.57550 type:complete len:406 (+) Transcript_17786:736-1953(+)
MPNRATFSPRHAAFYSGGPMPKDIIPVPELHAKIRPWRELGNNIKIYWVNVEKDVVRRRHMEAMLGARGLRHERINATTPDIVAGMSGFAEAVSRGTTCSNEELGNVVSQLRALRQGLDDGEEVFAVAEDDLVIPSEEGASRGLPFGELLAGAPESFDVLQLGIVDPTYRRRAFCEKCKKGKSWEKWRLGNAGAGLWIVTKTGAKKILEEYVQEIKGGKVIMSSGGIERHLARMPRTLANICTVASDIVMYFFPTARTYTSTIPLFDFLEVDSTIGLINHQSAASSANSNRVHEVYRAEAFGIYEDSVCDDRLQAYIAGVMLLEAGRGENAEYRGFQCGRIRPVKAAWGKHQASHKRVAARRNALWGKHHRQHPGRQKAAVRMQHLMQRSRQGRPGSFLRAQTKT